MTTFLGVIILKTALIDTEGTNTEDADIEIALVRNAYCIEDIYIGNASSFNTIKYLRIYLQLFELWI